MSSINAPFVRVFAIIRPHRLQEVKSALAMLPISGLTVADARGAGNNPEKPVSFLGREMLVPLPLRMTVEVAAPAELATDIVEAIAGAARTGEPGDGKIFVEPLLSAIRIRTGEKDADAL